MKKRVLCCLLVLCMLASAAPVTAFAAEAFLPGDPAADAATEDPGSAVPAENGPEIQIKLKAGSTISHRTPSDVKELFQGQEIPYTGWQLMKLVVTIPAQDGLTVTSVTPEVPSLYPDLSKLETTDGGFQYTYYFKENGTYVFDVAYTLQGVPGTKQAAYTVDDLLEIPDLTLRAYFLEVCDSNNYRGYITKTDLQEGRRYHYTPGKDEPEFTTQGWSIGRFGGPDGFFSYVKDLEGIQYVMSLDQLQLGDNSTFHKNPIAAVSLEPFTKGYYPQTKIFRLSDPYGTETHVDPAAYTSEMLGEILKKMPNLEEFCANGTGFRNLEVFGEMGGNCLDLLAVKANGITSLHGLENHTDLSNISINDNQISDLTPLKNVKTAVSWNFIRNNISDLTPIQNLKVTRQIHFGLQSVYPEPVLATAEGDHYLLELPMPIDIDGNLTKVGFANFLQNSSVSSQVPTEQRDKLLVKYAGGDIKLYPVTELEDGRVAVHIPMADVPQTGTANPFDGAFMRFWFENDAGTDSRTRGVFNGRVEFTATTVTQPTTCTVSYAFQPKDSALTLPEEVLAQLPEAEVVLLGDTVTLPEDLTLTDVKTADGTWTFVGWDKTEIPNIASDDRFVGTWELVKNTYTITYTDGVAEEVVFPDQTYTAEEGAATPAFPGIPTRDGYQFTGWHPAVAATVSGDVVYQAQWQKNDPSGGDDPTYILHYESNGGTLYPNEQYVQDALVALDKLPVREGYRFTGWYADHALTLRITEVKMDADKTVYAGWELKDTPVFPTYYTLRYESNGGTPYKTEQYLPNTLVALDKLPVREGYRFTGWYADPALTQRITEIKMTSHKTVYAGWEDDGVPQWLNGSDHFAYVTGYSDGTVRPLDNITRAEAAVIFFRLLNADTRASNLTNVNSFQDLSDDMWCRTAVSTMAKLGIITGRTPERFDPSAPITRAEFAAICARFDRSAHNASSKFTDIAGHWAKSEIERAASLGWITGYEDGAFRPENLITRAEAVTIINRMLNRLPENESDLLDGMRVWPDNQPGTWYYLAMQEATNSHTFHRKDALYERWTALTADPDWSRYEIN